jgi:hypothetical protein
MVVDLVAGSVRAGSGREARGGMTRLIFENDLDHQRRAVVQPIEAADADCEFTECRATSDVE